ncbi:hypothetical protein DPMN_127468 [Dreissena polymorpha]|uniref:Uncharacterized protein n=1 Tax=Dreissena polymorpha TaxID=45954 RepID=A0A9D4JZ65_DREPO|nr:hypothetical protein DPMN_127468 [Dreissena polymorpha]
MKHKDDGEEMVWYGMEKKWYGTGWRRNGMVQFESVIFSYNDTVTLCFSHINKCSSQSPVILPPAFLTRRQ